MILKKIFASNKTHMGLLHIHEVLNLIYSSNKIYTVDELKQEIIRNFGEDVYFTSCSENEFDIESMVDFMEQRGKILVQDNKIYPFGEACNH